MTTNRRHVRQPIDHGLPIRIFISGCLVAGGLMPLCIKGLAGIALDMSWYEVGVSAGVGCGLAIGLWCWLLRLDPPR